MTPQTVAHQAPLSVGFLRQEYWTGYCSLLQGIFPTQGSNLGLLHCRQILYHLSHQESTFQFNKEILKNKYKKMKPPNYLSIREQLTKFCTAILWVTMQLWNTIKFISRLRGFPSSSVGKASPGWPLHKRAHCSLFLFTCCTNSCPLPNSESEDSHPFLIWKWRVRCLEAQVPCVQGVQVIWVRVWRLRITRPLCTLGRADQLVQLIP